MKILSLDLATNTGYAYNDNRNEFHCGTWLLATDKELKAARKSRMNRRRDPRVVSLFKRLHGLHGMNLFDVIVFEDVAFSSYTLQCQLWSSFRAATWLTPALMQIGNPIFEAVPVGTLKKFATGHGGATKEMMVRALIKTDPHFTQNEDPACAYWHPDAHTSIRVDDNAVDAVWLWKWAKHNLSRIK